MRLEVAHSIWLAVLVSGCIQDAEATAYKTGRQPPGLRQYYVDSVAGSDAGNPCTVRATPCRTIARLMAVSPPAFSDIWLKRGSYFREQIFVQGYGSSGGLKNGSNVRAYGSGARPILDGADIITAGSWAKTGGRANVYQATVVSAGIFGYGGMGNRIWENGTRLTYVADVATCDATAGSWTGPTRPTGGADTFYVHASDGSNPALSGKIYEWPARPYGINGGQYKTDSHRIFNISGVEVRNFGHHDGGLLTSGYLSDFLVYSGGYGPVDPLHALWCNGVCEDGTTSDVVSYGNSLSHIEMRRLNINCDGNASSNMTGVFFHSGGVGLYKHGKHTYEDFRVTHCYSAFGGNSSTHVAIIRADVSDNTVRQFAAFAYIDRVDIVGVTWVRHDPLDTANAISLSSMGSAPINIFDSRFVTNGASPYALITVDNASSGTVAISGSSFIFTATGGWGTAYRSVLSDRTVAAPVVMTRNFTYYAYAPLLLPSSTNATVDYNVYDSTAGGWNLNGTVYATFASWQAAGKDAHSIQAAQTLAGDPTTGNTAPTSSSAAWTVGAGADAYGDANAEAFISTIP